MTALAQALCNRIGAHRVHELPDETGENIDLLLLDIESKIPIKVLMTNGLSDYSMPVPEKYEERTHNEIYFALPSYWEIEDHNNPKMNWPIQTLKKLANHVIEKQTWYGPGHTFSNGNPPKALSESMKQNYLLLADPIALEDVLQPLEIEEQTIFFLAIIPIFEQEFDRKQSKGYFKFIRKFRGRNGNEILDDFRTSIYKSRWRILG
ncbi:MAG: suppressor of fused domain protein [Bacteroidota bacterium]